MFNDITIEWGGVTHTIPANKVLMGIARVEEIITIAEIMRYGKVGAVPLARLAQAYAVLLRYAGFEVTDDAVYLTFVTSGKAMTVSQALVGIMILMVPPTQNKGGDVTPGKLPKTRSTSRVSTRRRSSTSKSSRRKTSGASPSANSGGSSMPPNPSNSTET